MDITVTKVGMQGCKPCEKVDEFIELLKETHDFEVKKYNIDMDAPFKDRREGKRVLMKYGTLNVPLVVFSKKGEDYAAVYKEHVGEDMEKYFFMMSDALGGNLEQE